MYVASKRMSLELGLYWRRQGGASKDIHAVLDEIPSAENPGQKTLLHLPGCG